MKRKSRNLIILLAVLALGALVLGYLEWNTPHQDVKDADGVKTDAFSLYSSFTKDSSKAKSSFLNKIIEVSGVVGEVSVNQQKQQVILLRSPLRAASVNCTMEEHINSLKSGDSVVVKGICSGFSGSIPEMNIPGDVLLVRCYLVK